MKFNEFFSSVLAEKLHEGSPALFPTDTLPAIGSLPSYSSQLWEIKKRPLSKPLILMGGDKEDLFKYVNTSALEDAIKMANLYWPGALTMVLPVISDDLKDLNLSSKNIGMRVPDSDLARDLLRKSGPLATTSANISGKPPSLNAIDAFKAFPELPLLAPSPWPIGSGLASTVILWEKHATWKLVRKGSVHPQI